ncbi:MAG: hypothetical protein N2645_12900 [Clostridia bacterium]|nr:hypothetical protein [Clostridia bacterium]
MGEIWGPVIGSLGFTALIITPIIINKLIKYKLEIAKINAETTIKAEEIRARNQLEIERLLAQDKNLQNQESPRSQRRFSDDEEYFEKPDRIRDRL